ncbi:hypothetical protein U2F26_34975 [Micromonospora sp. 4G57]|uniref:hypothetical protein n=1 Tax=Micromonospora TaxID=1873 RepID=UPI002ACA0A8C|nr:hypothetical protein [Micromonospora sp. 4G53]MDZ5447845.1 hypothetical protein [Micromonospora sp. 4G57]
MAQLEPRTPPPPWPPRADVASDPSPNWNAFTQWIRVKRQRSDKWWPYAVFGGITLLIGCIAMAVVALAL